MPVPAPADKRFRRSHVHPAKKRRWVPSGRTIGIVLVAGVVAVYGLSRIANFMFHAKALTIQTINVEGTNRMSRGEVLAILDDLRGVSMVTVDLEEWRQKLLAAPWVADVAMRRAFPGTVSVVITEREPLGIGRIKGKPFLIDRTGMVIDEFGPKYADFDLPIIDNLTAGDGSTDAARAALAGRILADLQSRPDVLRLVSQIDVSNAGDAVVILRDDTALIHTGDDNFAERVQAYLDYAPRLREDVPQIDSVYMQFGDRVFVKPQGTGGK
jgi:cell division septal protein FtsQ